MEMPCIAIDKIGATKKNPYKTIFHGKIAQSNNFIHVSTLFVTI